MFPHKPRGLVIRSAMTNHYFSVVSEGSLGRLLVRGAFRREQLQHVLPDTEREENLLSVRQSRAVATHPDPGCSAAG